MPQHQVLTADIIDGINEHEIEPLIYEATSQSIAWLNALRSVEKFVRTLIDESEAVLSGMNSMLS